MSEDYPHLSCHLPPKLYELFCGWKQQHKYTSDSEALIAVLVQFLISGTEGSAQANRSQSSQLDQQPRSPDPSLLNAVGELAQRIDYLSNRLDSLDNTLSAIDLSDLPEHPNQTGAASSPPTAPNKDIQGSTNQTTPTNPGTTFSQQAANFQFSNFSPAGFNPPIPEPPFPSDPAINQPAPATAADQSPAHEQATKSEESTEQPDHEPEPIAWEVWAYLERRRKDTLRQVDTFDSEWQANRFLEQAERERKAGLKVHYEIRPIFAPDPDPTDPNDASDASDPEISSDDRAEPRTPSDSDAARADHENNDAIDVEVIFAPEPVATSSDRDSAGNPQASASQENNDADIDADTASTTKQSDRPDAQNTQLGDQKNTDPAAANNLNPTAEIESPPDPMHQSEPKVEIFTDAVKPNRDRQDLSFLDNLINLATTATETETIPDRLTQVELAQRLEVSNHTLNRYKLNPGFAGWCRKQPKQQPRGEVWQYDPGDDLFHRLE
ncbi:hypothetical protein Pse7367_1958 [Thalassoporum mexicanum PCC 7367]|uniref:hypothetical protein n=1 Tax=Thalassoporum mexicanum TaxID=3457544 RepID=UPI00029FF4D3|nr:hypothetical protein [Pseudanabaena sp. PCC 7367]AFY70233.1 hypothetical protein Pse7367_1958 [Pseudanabaena sp. PCC 7367]